MFITSPLSTWMETWRGGLAHGIIMWLEYWGRYNHGTIIYQNTKMNTLKLLKCEKILRIVSLLLNTTQIGTSNSPCWRWIDFGCAVCDHFLTLQLMPAEGNPISVSSLLRAETLFEIKVSFPDIVVECEWIFF